MGPEYKILGGNQPNGSASLCSIKPLILQRFSPKWCLRFRALFLGGDGGAGAFYQITKIKILLTGILNLRNVGLQQEVPFH